MNKGILARYLKFKIGNFGGGEGIEPSTYAL
jgi:hypothetical protein